MVYYYNILLSLKVKTKSFLIVEIIFVKWETARETERDKKKKKEYTKDKERGKLGQFTGKTKVITLSLQLKENKYTLKENKYTLKLQVLNKYTLKLQVIHQTSVLIVCRYNYIYS